MYCFCMGSFWRTRWLSWPCFLLTFAHWLLWKSSNIHTVKPVFRPFSTNAPLLPIFTGSQITKNNLHIISHYCDLDVVYQAFLLDGSHGTTSCFGIRTQLFLVGCVSVRTFVNQKFWKKVSKYIYTRSVVLSKCCCWLFNCLLSSKFLWEPCMYVIGISFYNWLEVNYSF